MDKDTVRVASVAMHSVMGDPSANLERVAEWAHKAHAQGADFGILPEECITGSMNKSDLTFEEARKIAAAAAEESVPFLESLARKLQMTLVVGTIEPFGEQLRNSALIVGAEGYLATFSKLHLPNPNEREWFVPGDTFPVVASQGWTFGVGICYDLRFPELFRGAAQKGAELFFIPVGGSGQ
ncbi:carbon-nitrogen hydrolase family protein [Candidatus Poribacteria bacterium]|nr:carbon-nitrogen hydrolase family protein [Candidatus Poribacteria bacterium]